VRTIGVVTVARSDYGLLRPVLRAIEQHPQLELHLLVGGMHLAAEFGRTISMIEDDGFTVGASVAAPVDTDDPAGIARAMGRGTIGFGEALGERRPDVLLVLGDRYETHAAVTAALPFALPVAHVHGGESTEGLIDEAIRHSITKMSHLHFAATEEYGRRIVQMGESPWRVTVSGAPGLDEIRVLEPLGGDELEREYGLRVTPETLLVTYHPVTLEIEETEARVRALLDALEASGRDVVFTAPNADTSRDLVARAIDELVARSDRAVLVRDLGTRAYLTLLGRVAAMVGNSSSGIIEAASFRLPVVNVGSRQQGRARAANVIDTGDSRDEILDGIRRAVAPEFRAGLHGLENPYGDGHAAARIVSVLAEVPLDRRLIVKSFHDLG
jgi:UDP-N-acetylglucosamine 2-epimerase (non-hydrolysing)/GDP/UDP-N,N'-diacetylbacillosamine 2-epimerase (hydrolysing)